MNHQKGNLVSYVRRGVILQQVNAQGVMGSGIAKDIRERWPAVWEAYSAEVQPPRSVSPGRGAEHLGKVIPVQVEPDLWVYNLVGQQFYGRDERRYTSYDALDTALARAGQIARLTGLFHYDFHHPYMGCGLGGGYWPVVAALIEHHIGPDTTLWSLD